MRSPPLTPPGIRSTYLGGFLKFVAWCDTPKVSLCSVAASICNPTNMQVPVPPLPALPWSRQTPLSATLNLSKQHFLLASRFSPSMQNIHLLWPLLTSPASSVPIAENLLWIVQRKQEISRGKTLPCPLVAGRFTLMPFWMTIGRDHPLLAYPDISALYLLSVRPLQIWPPASSPPHFTVTQLPSARNSRHQGSQGTYTP